MIPECNKLCKTFAFELILAEETNHPPDRNNPSINLLFITIEEMHFFCWLLIVLLEGVAVFCM